MSLREVSRGGAGDGDAGDVECCRTNVGEGNDLGGAGGAHGYGAEVQTRGSEFGCGAYSSEWYQLWAAGGTVGHAERCAACADDGRGERNAEGALGTRGQGGAAGVSLGEVRSICASNGNSSNGQRGGANVGQGDRLGYGDADGHVAERKTRGREFRSGTSSTERHLLRTAAAIVGDADGG